MGSTWEVALYGRWSVGSPDYTYRSVYRGESLWAVIQTVWEYRRWDHVAIYRRTTP